VGRPTSKENDLLHETGGSTAMKRLRGSRRKPTPPLLPPQNEIQK
jgi:hypothetical protein